MGPQHQPSGGDARRVELGWALHARGDDVADAVLRQLDDHANPQVRASIAAADRLATEVVGRWLATGEGATEAEHAQLSGPGSLVNAIDLPALIKAYLAWREATVAVLDEEGARLGSDEALLAEARHVIARSSDSSIVRMARQFDLERRRLEDALDVERAKLVHQTLHDSLTGLPNRTLLYDRIAHALQGIRRYGGAAAVLFVDLDGFKAVNDSFGHETGDALLVAIADRLRVAVRPSDTVARIGGDEFVVLCDRLDDVGEAAVVAGRILRTLRDPLALPSGEVVLTASVGIALAGEDEPDELVRRADQAMYVAKRRGDAYELAEGLEASATTVT